MKPHIVIDSYHILEAILSSRKTHMVNTSWQVLADFVKVIEAHTKFNNLIEGAGIYNYHQRTIQLFMK